ncbi:hypothetical protein [Paenibacillus sp. HJGM_3]|uniref:hypothetical protein n=1 Tax=Paenibacillus sp. HJGM_3 TaxID=3379816 RepID=UPI0038581536
MSGTLEFINIAEFGLFAKFVNQALGEIIARDEITMTSFIWGRSPNEAYENPYEYEAQNQFQREAEVLAKELFTFLMKRNGTYPRDARSVISRSFKIKS